MRGARYTMSTTATKSPAARDLLERIARLFAIEANIRGKSPTNAWRRPPEQRPFQCSRELKAFLEATLDKISGKSALAGAIRYALPAGRP